MTVLKHHADRCMTHHHACDCREYQFQELREAAQTVVDRMRGSGGINPDAADALLKLAALLERDAP